MLEEVDVIEDKFATDEETRTAFAELSDVDLLRLSKIARQFVAGISYLETTDLINEAVICILERGKDGKSRRWPKSVDFLVFFANVMKSIASSYRRRSENMHSKVVALDVVRENQSTDTPSLAVGNENEMVARYDARCQLKDIWSIFKGDDNALTVLDAIIEEKSKADVLQQTGMTSNEYDAAKKRIRRKIEHLKQA